MKPINIAGGGLAGCLLLAALKNRWPELNVQLHEKSDRLCGAHTWSFHQHDVPNSCWPWLKPLISQSWSSYNVYFPKYGREFKSAYHSIRSTDLAHKITEKHSDSISLESTLPESEIDFRTTGWPHLMEPSHYGYQKFVGLEVETKEPHGLTAPILKDVRCPQTDGYRFFYVLPFSPHSLLIEDTYYSNSPELAISDLIEGIHRYAANKSWNISQVLKTERGSLPLDLYASKTQYHPRALGSAAGLAHPVTGYTLPLILRQIDALLQSSHPDLNTWGQKLEKANHELRRPFSYYRLLNRMMFHAALPEKRYQVLERFYTLSEGLIQRFYGGQTTRLDQARILIGKPPVPISKALFELRDQAPTA